MNRLNFLKNLFGFGVLGILPKITEKPIVTSGPKKEIYCNYVKGLVYYQGKYLVSTMTSGEHLEIVREPENAFDTYAIALYYNKVKLGFVPAEDNIILSQMMDAGHGHFTAEISEADANAAYWAQVSFKIFSHQIIKA